MSQEDELNECDVNSEDNLNDISFVIKRYFYLSTCNLQQVQFKIFCLLANAHKLFTALLIILF